MYSYYTSDYFWHVVLNFNNFIRQIIPLIIAHTTEEKVMYGLSLLHEDGPLYGITKRDLSAFDFCKRFIRYVPNKNNGSKFELELLNIQARLVVNLNYNVTSSKSKIIIDARKAIREGYRITAGIRTSGVCLISARYDGLHVRLYYAIGIGGMIAITSDINLILEYTLNMWLQTKKIDIGDASLFFSHVGTRIRGRLLGNAYEEYRSDQLSQTEIH